MVLVCPQCSRTNGAKAKFCHSCGSDLSASAETTAAPGEETAPLSQSDLNVEPAADIQPEAVSQPQAQRPPPEPRGEPTPLPPSTNEVFQAPPAPLDLENAIEKEIEELVGEVEPATVHLDEQAERFIEESDSPVAATVEVSFERVLVADCSSFFTIRVTNVSPDVLESVEIILESKAFAKSARVRLPKIPSLRAAERSVEIQVRDPGNPLLNCTLTFDASGERCSYAGSRSIRVLDRPASLANVSISIGDILSNRDGGVSDNEKAVVSNLVDLSKVQTLNDLLNLEIPVKFQPIRLYEDYQISYNTIQNQESSRQESLSIPQEFLRPPEPGAVLALRPLTGDPEATLTLVSRPVFRLGRSRRDADLATWFLPRSPENDARTMRMSKIHVLCEEIGSALWLKDAGSSNGSFYENRPLRAGVQFERRGTLELGGDYRLHTVYFPSNFPEAPPISNLSDWSGPAATATTVRGSVRFEQPKETPAEARQPWQSLWLLSDATFGSSHATPLPLSLPGLAEIQGRFFYFCSCFWIQNLVANSAVAVDGRVLSENETCPLGSGMKILLAGAVFDLQVR